MFLLCSVAQWIVKTLEEEARKQGKLLDGKERLEERIISEVDLGIC